MFSWHSTIKVEKNLHEKRASFFFFFLRKAGNHVTRNNCLHELHNDIRASKHASGRKITSLVSRVLARRFSRAFSSHYSL